MSFELSSYLSYGDVIMMLLADTSELYFVLDPFASSVLNPIYGNCSSQNNSLFSACSNDIKSPNNMFLSSQISKLGPLYFGNGKVDQICYFTIGGPKGIRLNTETPYNNYVLTGDSITLIRTASLNPNTTPSNVEYMCIFPELNPETQSNQVNAVMVGNTGIGCPSNEFIIEVPVYTFNSQNNNSQSNNSQNNKLSSYLASMKFLNYSKKGSKIPRFTNYNSKNKEPTIINLFYAQAYGPLNEKDFFPIIYPINSGQSNVLQVSNGSSSENQNDSNALVFLYPESANIEYNCCIGNFPKNISKKVCESDWESGSSTCKNIISYMNNYKSSQIVPYYNNSFNGWNEANEFAPAPFTPAQFTPSPSNNSHKWSKKDTFLTIGGIVLFIIIVFIICAILFYVYWKSKNNKKHKKSKSSD